MNMDQQLSHYLKQSENGKCEIDPLLTEAAIKIVQASGYTVFKNSAQYQAYATHSVSAMQYASHAQNDRGFDEYIKRDLARKLGDAMLKQGALVFSQPPPTTDGSDRWHDPLRMKFMLEFKGFFSKDAEFKRRG